MRRPTVRGANIIAILSAGGAVFLLASSMALADPNTGAEPVPTAEADVNPAKSAPDDFGPVDTKFISLANVAPGVYSWFNDGAVFGLPGTRVGSITERTHLTNDWGGLRMTCPPQIDPGRMSGSRQARLPRNLVHDLSEFSILPRSGTKCPPLRYSAGGSWAKLLWGRMSL
jgi:hypothetical protein